MDDSGDTGYLSAMDDAVTAADDSSLLTADQGAAVDNAIGSAVSSLGTYAELVLIGGAAILVLLIFRR